MDKIVCKICVVAENHFQGHSYVTGDRRYSIKALDTIQKLFQYFENFPVNVEEIIVNLRIMLARFQVNNSAHFTLTRHCISTKAVNNAAIIFRPLITCLNAGHHNTTNLFS